MDKNMVNIDDLVRQRLLGGEEKERAGAWLRMSELLEEEMPRRRGAFMWRRTFGALGVMALLGAIALGGYELNSYRNLHNNTTDGTAIAVSAPAPTANGISSHNTTADNTDNTANSNNTTGNNAENTTSTNHTDNSTNNNEPNNNINNKQTNHIIAANSSISHNNNYTGKKATNANNVVKQTTAPTVVNSTAAVANTVAGSNAVAGSNNEVAQPERIAATSDVATTANTITGNTTASSNDAAIAGNSHAKKSGDAGSSHVKAANTTTDKRVATDRHTTSGKQTASGTTAGSAVTGNEVAKIGKTGTGSSSDLTKSGDIPAELTDEANEAGNKIAATDKIAATETTGNKTADSKTATTGSKKAATGHPTTAKSTETATATAKSTGTADRKSAPATGTATKTGTATTGLATVKKSAPKGGHHVTATIAKTPSTDETKTKTAETGAEDNEDNATAQAGNNRSGNTTTKPGSTKAARYGNDLAVVGSSAASDNTTLGTKKTIAAKIAAKNVTGENGNITGRKKIAAIAKTPATVGVGAKGATIAHKNNSVNGRVVASASANNTRTVSPTAFSNRIPAANKTAQAGSKEAGDNVGEVSLVNSRKHKKVIEKIVLLHRYMSNAPKEGERHLDTISIESITEEYEMASTQKADALKNGNEVPTSEDPDADTSPLKPSSSSESFAMKEAANKQTKGSKTIENLNAAFNDIKYNAGNATFAAGISAGINSTFFGPNNFKGFQFGLNGTLTFSQSLSLMAEIKYFHRINDNFTLNDNYYQYTAEPSGGYKRELVSNPYNISTLHSLEMPIALRFTAGRFNFAVGPNVVYTFGINTGNYRTVDPNSATIVPAMGNDNTAKIQAGDFNSRFGLGYLFGVSYQVSPKVTIDLRDVQTIWDNANTAGSKAVSTQLFRSPSFQLSLGYKFGGGKKDQDR